MSNIDMSMVITAKAHAEDQMKARALLIKSACQARIITVLDEKTVSNITGGLLLGKLTDAERETFAKGHGWVQDTIAACRSLILDPEADWQDDAAWPLLPDGVADLAERF